MSKFQSNEIKEKRKLYTIEAFKCQCINESHRSQKYTNRKSNNDETINHHLMKIEGDICSRWVYFINKKQ